ncbi:DegT/DnrJ/EryC1/StrS aminotransferase family protein [Porphyromonas sp. COT-052 OH4946]|uniref:DegT/DnrJ/EryC1/StrS family aminotransferase n=1 Tax=Porphyromonas sp. COT-052 OH4946 TaxID=1515618 RepID=UPI000AD57A6E|nr:DegT/DnrJ/EryC1/StrS family aminotransferase [Porphyromonas sp. COT-052 OH4946]
MPTSISRPIVMVDLKKQYQQLKKQIDEAIQGVIDSTAFINGKEVHAFAEDLAAYLNVKHVIPCANGTDALQISLMAVGLKAGDEIIVPDFTYAASAEAIGLLGLTPIFADVDPVTFNLTPESCEKCLSDKTKAIIPVHLFGQSCNMEPLLDFAKRNDLFVIEDNAQAMGGEYTFSDGNKRKTGTMGHIGCTSFFPSKNLGCYGDGGAITTNDDELAERVRMISNHGQKVKYKHDIIGCNSRLDTIQAAVLSVKLQYLDRFNTHRNEVASCYTSLLEGIEWLHTPISLQQSVHVYHQYTLKLFDENTRDRLREHLTKHKIASMIYYPIPLHRQPAFIGIARRAESLDVSESLSRTVLSIPIYPEMETEEIHTVVSAIKTFEPSSR